MRPDVTREPPLAAEATGASARRPLHRRFFPIPIADLPWLHPGEPEACRRDLAQFLPVLAHLALIVAVSRAYRLEGRGFQLLLTTTLAAVPLHYAMPYAWKKPTFLLASLIGLWFVFGTITTATVAALGLGLITIARLPIPWAIRAGLIAASAVAMACLRAGVAASPAPDVVWPILASMFMFRMIVYLYELKHADGPESWLDAVCYFFLLPNACFVHFPVVDYRTFRRGYFARDVHDTQRAGLAMMSRGVTHLLLYRLVYHELLIRPEDVHSLAGLAGFLTCNYLLYLRVSGQFHMAVGMLHLFGFSLPETHHHYLLATSFTDYWRRINICWKDFMVRVVFNPVAFRLKRRGQPAAMAAATVAVFLTTWALHAYQSFWLRGSWGLSAPDGLFWGILGALVLVNVQVDARSTRRARAGGRDSSAKALAIRCAKTLGTFATIALLWSLWSSPSVSSWLSMLRRAFA